MLFGRIGGNKSMKACTVRSLKIWHEYFKMRIFFVWLRMPKPSDLGLAGKHA